MAMKMMKATKTNSTSDYDDFDYEPYEERKGKIKLTASANRERRGIKNWKKVWIDHASDYEEVEDFFRKS